MVIASLGGCVNMPSTRGQETISALIATGIFIGSMTMKMDLIGVNPRRLHDPRSINPYTDLKSALVRTNNPAPPLREVSYMV